MKTLEEKLTKTLSKWFPDDMDASMYHPGMDGAVDDLKSLFTATLKEVVAEVIGEDEKEYVIKKENARVWFIRGANNLRDEQHQRLQAIIKSLEKI